MADPVGLPRGLPSHEILITKASLRRLPRNCVKQVTAPSVHSVPSIPTTSRDSDPSTASVSASLSRTSVNILVRGTSTSADPPVFEEKLNMASGGRPIRSAKPSLKKQEAEAAAAALQASNVERKKTSINKTSAERENAETDQKSTSTTKELFHKGPNIQQSAALANDLEAPKQPNKRKRGGSTTTKQTVPVKKGTRNLSASPEKTKTIKSSVNRDVGGSEHGSDAPSTTKTTTTSAVTKTPTKSQKTKNRETQNSAAITENQPTPSKQTRSQSRTPDPKKSTTDESPSKRKHNDDNDADDEDEETPPPKKKKAQSRTSPTKTRTSASGIKSVTFDEGTKLSSPTKATNTSTERATAVPASESIAFFRRDRLVRQTAKETARDINASKRWSQVATDVNDGGAANETWSFMNGMSAEEYDIKEGGEFIFALAKLAAEQPDDSDDSAPGTGMEEDFVFAQTSRKAPRGKSVEQSAATMESRARNSNSASLKKRARTSVADTAAAKRPRRGTASTKTLAAEDTNAAFVFTPTTKTISKTVKLILKSKASSTAPVPPLEVALSACATNQEPGNILNSSRANSPIRTTPEVPTRRPSKTPITKSSANIDTTTTRRGIRLRITKKDGQLTYLEGSDSEGNFPGSQIMKIRTSPSRVTTDTTPDTAQKADEKPRTLSPTKSHPPMNMNLPSDTPKPPRKQPFDFSSDEPAVSFAERSRIPASVLPASRVGRASPFWRGKSGRTTGTKHNASTKIGAVGSESSAGSSSSSSNSGSTEDEECSSLEDGSEYHLEEEEEADESKWERSPRGAMSGASTTNTVGTN